MTFCHARAASDELYIYIWYDFIPDFVIEEFEQEFGKKVYVDFYDSNQSLEAQLLTKKSGYDLVFPSAFPYFARQIKRGLYLPLDRSKLPNLKHMDPDILEVMSQADPDNQYGLPYFWGVTGIGYNIDMVKRLVPNAPLDSWAMLYDPDIVSKLAPCGVYFLDEASDLFTTALIYMGKDPHNHTEQDIAEAFELLRKVRPFATRFDVHQAPSSLANGEVCVAQNWSGDIARGRQSAIEAGTGNNIGFIMPKEGVPIWIDVVAIPRDARHPDTAHLFLNFLMRPDIMARITNETEFATANLAAMSLIEEDIRNNEIVYPPKDVLDRAFVSTVKSREQERKLNRMILKLKTKEGVPMSAKPQYIYKIANAEFWQQLQDIGSSPGAGIDIRDGYIHISTAHQLPRIMDKYYANEADVLLLKIATENIAEDTKWEQANNGKTYPHLFRQIRVGDVVQVIQLSDDSQERASQIKKLKA
ncbi:MAG: extracellular solute-binding protein [Alphaproteobacteria bacterium]